MVAKKSLAEPTRGANGVSVTSTHGAAGGRRQDHAHHGRDGAR